MFKALFNLLGLADFFVKLFERRQIEEVGAIKQNTTNLKAEIAANEKEISDLRTEKDFSDYVAADPAEAERLRQLLNTRPHH